MLFTTSRKPSRKTLSFAKDLVKSLPSTVYFPRGKKGVEELISDARYKGFNSILVLCESHGNPVSLKKIELTEGEWDYSFEAKIRLLGSRKEISGFTASLQGIGKVSVREDVKNFLELKENSGAQETEFREEKGKLNFYRNGSPVGPEFEVKGIERI